MAGRPGLDPTEEGKSYSALFVLMVAVLLVSAVWSIWDDNISRRPWKDYQVKWDRLAYDRYMKDADEEQKRLNADPEYQKVSKDLAAAQKELDSGATGAKLADLHAQLVDLKVAADDKDQMVRFTKSFLTERWYDYNHAVQEKEDPTPYKNEIDRLNAEITKIASRPDVRKMWQEQGAVPMIMSPTEFDRYLNEDIAKWAKVVKFSGARPDQ